MKTIQYHVSAAMLAGIAALLLAGAAQAEEPGVVRLSDFAFSGEDAVAEGETVVRGASAMVRRNQRTSAALRGFLTTAGSNCDACVPCDGGACDACCPVDCGVPGNAAGCCPVNDECCPQSCATPSGACIGGCNCPGSCNCGGNPCTCSAGACCAPDGCDAGGRYRISDCCQACGGRGCSACSHGSRREMRRAARNSGCPQCDSSSCLNNNCIARCLSTQAAAHRARNRMASANMNQYLHCKFGHFIHDGSGGVGSPLWGHYNVVYPVSASTADPRDGQVYAAQGYGGAVSVPLAPTVGHTYNYGWGIPSSRLTPVSNIFTP